MTAVVATALFALGGIALAVATWLKRADDRRCEFANTTHTEETR